MFLQFNSLVRRYCGFSRLPNNQVAKRKFYSMDFPLLLKASSDFNSTHVNAALNFIDVFLNHVEVYGPDWSEDQVDIVHLCELVTLEKLLALRYQELPLNEQYRKFTIVDGEDWEIVD